MRLTTAGSNTRRFLRGRLWQSVGSQVHRFLLTSTAATDPDLPIPKSSAYFAMGFAIFGSISTLIKHYYWVGERRWIRLYHPNMMCVALAFVVPQTFCECSSLARSGANHLRRYCNGNGLNLGLYMGEEEPLVI
jgi:hypothetical protein